MNEKKKIVITPPGKTHGFKPGFPRPENMRVVGLEGGFARSTVTPFHDPNRRGAGHRRTIVDWLG